MQKVETVYRTPDGKIFKCEEDAKEHTDWLMKRCRLEERYNDCCYLVDQLDDKVPFKNVIDWIKEDKDFVKELLEQCPDTK